jgi:molecular chaperone DnaK
VTVADEDASKEDLEKAAKELNDKMMPIGAKMYEQASDTEASEDKPDDADDKKTEADTVEGEVIDDKDTKKE